MIIGLTGKIGSGKSSVAEILENSHGFKRMKFSGALKDMLRAIGLTEAQLEGDEKEKIIPWLGVTPRRMMQTLGTEWGRYLVNDNLWVRLLRQQIFNGGDGRYVIEDVRFKNEADMITNFNNAFLWRIDRPGLGERTHSSENNLVDYPVDGEIINDGDLLRLNQYVETAYKTCEYLANQTRH